MNIRTRNIGITASLFASFFVLIVVSSASAQSQRTFVSGLGSDSNPCSRTAPCRTFAQALLGTNPGGEVVVLDSGGFGPVSITKSVSITAPPGIYAGISVFSGDGIDINAGSTDTVTLRGLTINNQGSTGSGIVFTAGRALHVEGCVVSRFSSGSGVSFQAGGSATLEVKDSIMTDNWFGIRVAPPVGGQALATIEHTRFERNTSTALGAEPGAYATVRSSVASGNGGGFAVFSSGGTPSELNIENCVASNNQTGILCYGLGAAAVVRLSNSTITGNQKGLHAVGVSPMLLSRGNNTVEGNFLTNWEGSIGSYGAT